MHRCQPWSILGTGVGVIAAANLLSHGNIFWTGFAALPIAVWWYVFLVLVPAEFKEYVEAQSQLQDQLQENPKRED